MQGLTPVEVAIVVFGAILAIASAVNTLGSAAEKVIKAVRSSRAPNEAQDARLDALEADMREVKTKLGADYKHLSSLDECNQVTLQALIALLAHGIDGNNMEQMINAKKALETHLIKR